MKKNDKDYDTELHWSTGDVVLFERHQGLLHKLLSHKSENYTVENLSVCAVWLKPDVCQGSFYLHLKED